MIQSTQIHRITRLTIIELVVSISLLSVITGLTGMVIFALSKQWSGLQTQARILAECQAVDRIAESAFRNAFPFSWTDEDNTDSPILLFIGNSYECYFTYRHPAAGDPPTTLRFIRIYLEHEKVMAEYRNTPCLPENARRGYEENIQREVIASGVNKLTFNYAYRDPQSGSVSWITSWDNEEEETIPIAINMYIEWADGSRHAWLRRTAGNGFAENYDIRKDEYEDEFKPILGDGAISSSSSSSSSSSTSSSGGGSSNRPGGGGQGGGEGGPPTGGGEGRPPSGSGMPSGGGGRERMR